MAQMASVVVGRRLLAVICAGCLLQGVLLGVVTMLIVIESMPPVYRERIVFDYKAADPPRELTFLWWDKQGVAIVEYYDGKGVPQFDKLSIPDAQAFDLKQNGVVAGSTLLVTYNFQVRSLPVRDDEGALVVSELHVRD